VRTLDVRSRPRTINSASTTKDLQMVNVSLRVLYRPKTDMCAVIVKTIGMDYEAVVFGRTQDGVDGVGNEVLKEVVSFFTAEELLRSREQFVAAVRQKLAQKTQTHHIILDDVSVTHLSYGREYARAIESKQVAQQEAERQTYVVQKADQERLASIIRAEGEAEAAERISKAMKSAGNGLIEVRRIDTAKEVAALISKSRGNITYLPGGDKSNVLLGVDNK
jgi:prohibitin 1